MQRAGALLRTQLPCYQAGLEEPGAEELEGNCRGRVGQRPVPFLLQFSSAPGAPQPVLPLIPVLPSARCVQVLQGLRSWVSSVPRALLGMSHCLQYYLILLIIIFLSFFLFFLAISLGFWDLSSPTRG